MSINTDTMALILMGESLLVIGMLLHLVVRSGWRIDLLCTAGLLAASLGLQQSARALDAPENLYSSLSVGFALFCCAMAIWVEGLRRVRNVG